MRLAARLGPFSTGLDGLFVSLFYFVGLICIVASACLATMSLSHRPCCVENVSAKSRDTEADVLFRRSRLISKYQVDSPPLAAGRHANSEPSRPEIYPCCNREDELFI